MDICPVCGKKVCFAEKVHALGRTWHNTCFCCTRCNKVLRPGEHLDNNNEPYCKACYSRKFGPKGVRGSIVMDTEVDRSKMRGSSSEESNDRPARLTSGEIDNSSRSFKDLRSMFEK